MTSKLKQNENIKIWDADELPPVHLNATVLWRGFANESMPEIVSIPQLIEENSDNLRARYLSRVYELGEIHIDGHRLVDHLQLRQGLSYWWMTLLSEKCNFAKSSLLNDLIRILAFTDWVAARSIKKVTLISSNKLLADSLLEWCEKHKIIFEWIPIKLATVRSCSIKRVYESSPSVIQALAWLIKYIILRWPLRGLGIKRWENSSGKHTFFSYSDNCVPDAINQGCYASRYWANLPDILESESCPTNWLHIYVIDSIIPTAKQAAKVIRKLNLAKNKQQCHVTLDTFLGPVEIFRTLRDFFHFNKLRSKLDSKLSQINHQSVPNFWPILYGDWQKSMSGSDAISNLLFFNLLETALKKLPKQRHGIYLQENISWEFGLIYMWQLGGHGCLTGVPHSTVRYWDLRYFFDPRTYERKGKSDLPLPNYVACNGPAMISIFKQGGYPENKLINVEALRYLHLERSQQPRKPVSHRQNKLIRLLVIGDYLISNTSLQMGLLAEAVSLLGERLQITFKPHPNCFIKTSDYPSIEFQVRTDPLSQLFFECDLAYASATTSGAVDAYCSGVPVISVINPNSLNLSPLRECIGASFVSTSDALACEIVSISDKMNKGVNIRPVYFSIDSKLSNWRKLLMNK